MPVGLGFLSAFLEKLSPLVKLSGDPIFNKQIVASPGAGGLAWDGEYFYLNYYVGKQIYVVSPSGTLINTLSLARTYTDIDYDPITDTLWAVDPSLTGVDRLSKADGSKIETITNSLVNNKYTSIALDPYNDRCYLLYQTLYSLAVVKRSTMGSLIRIIYFPYIELSQPKTVMVFTDSENPKKFWVGFASFPVLLGRVEDGVDKIDAYRILGASFDQVKASISMRFVNNMWYYWGDWGMLGRANLYRLTGMPPAGAPLPTLTIPDFDQDVYRWFNDDNAENPTPRAVEDTEIDNIAVDEVLRFRLGIKETTGSVFPWSGQLKLQYATSPLGPWTDLGAIGATDKVWNYANGKGDDGLQIATLLLSNTTIKEYFSESSPSNVGLSFRSPDRGEWDFAVTPYFPVSLQDYYFRALNLRDGLIKTFSKIPKAKTVVVNYEWFSDFEADAVGSIPAQWVESDPQFRVKDDQAAVGSHSVRVDRANGLCVGIRTLRNTPTTARVQFYWRVQETVGVDRNARSIINGDGGNYTNIAFLNSEKKFRYLNSAGAWTLLPNAPAALPNIWYRFDIRCDIPNNRWKAIIDGVNDSGWLAPRLPSTKLTNVQLDNWSISYAVTYAWWDEVDYKVSLP